MHFVHELTVGGGSVHVHQLMKDTLALGHGAAVATFQWGSVVNWLKADGIDVFVMDQPEDLVDVARDWKADVLHGHTCGGGSYACKVAQSLGIIGGETIHSMVGGSNPEADFEVVELDCLQRMRPKSTRIRWAYWPERFTIFNTKEYIRREFGIPKDVPIIGRNGRLDGSKSPEDFVRALAKLPNCWGILAGEGPEKKNLIALAESLGCSERLKMPGHRGDLGSVFNTIDIIVYPTRDESVCAGVHEPLFLKKPVVCYPVGGMSETIIHRKTGLHASNVNELVYWVNYLLDNPSIGKALGEAGREQIKRNGQDDPVKEAQLHLNLYQSLM